MSLVPNNIRESIDLIKRTVAKGCTDQELELFVRQCERTGLDPFARQIYAIKRYDDTVKAEVMQTQVSIDGLRTLAGETGEMLGQEGPFWCDELGDWSDVWLGKGDPPAAKVTVLRYARGEAARFTGVALWASYCQTKKDGSPTKMWRQMGPEMLAKCAEALALRKAFPQRLSGLYTSDEMAQAANERPYAPEAPIPHSEPESPVLAPPRPSGGDTGANPKASPIMRARVAKALAALNGPQRSVALELADAARLALPDEAGGKFDSDVANRWLDIIKEVSDAS